MKLLTCIGCPVGCQIEVQTKVVEEKEEISAISGYACSRGLRYARKEVMEAVRTVCVEAPIAVGDVVLANVADTSVNIVATKSVRKNKNTSDGE